MTDALSEAPAYGIARLLNEGRDERFRSVRQFAQAAHILLARTMACQLRPDDHERGHRPRSLVALRIRDAAAEWLRSSSPRSLLG